MLKKCRKTMLASALVSLLGSHFVYADSKNMSELPYSPWYLSEAQQGWHYDAFIGFGSEPTYAGSDDSEGEVDGNFRAFYVTNSGDRYYISLGELGGYWTLGKDTQLVAFFEYEEGRASDDDPIFQHFEDVESTLEGQFFLVHRWGDFYASAALQPDLLGRGKGLVWFLAAGHDWFINEDFRFSLSADISGANQTYMETEFGINESESVSSGLAVYRPSAGLKSLSAIATAEYVMSDSFSLISSVEWEQYLDQAADSPLINDNGNKNNISYNLLLRYRW